MGYRIVLGLLAAALAYNGIHMLVAAEDWYRSIDTVPLTGPFNSHFVRDIGCAYLAAALGMLIGAWRTQWLVPATLPALTFLGLHACVHVADALGSAESAQHAGIADAIGVYGLPLLAALCAILALRIRPQAT